jgi:peptidoglycan hydrolase CwlO-like protein
MKNYIFYTIILLILSVVAYFTFTSNGKLINTSHYDATVDSLNQVIIDRNKKVDSLNESVKNKVSKINQYQTDLANLTNKLNKEKKNHEKDINRINSISNRDISNEFANAFK